ncbi:MAG: NADH-quinone oxidoreductase subunit H, partial [Nitrospinae bacterium]|nr:NADH-quinone oxidoreductase subunit H [Nitrospinota bacterium]
MEIIITLVKLVVFFLILLQAVPILVWLERRLLGRFQLRPGPNRVGPFGLLQTLADGIKLLFKESIVHNQVDMFLYLLGPFLVVFTAFAAFSVIPIGAPFELFGNTISLSIADLNIGLLFVFAVLS